MIYLETFGYFGLFLAAFIAASILPLSSEPLVSLFVYQEKNLVLIVCIASLGNFLGGMLDYYIGRLGKMKWCEKYLGVNEVKVRGWQSKINRYGSILAFMTWLPIVGDPLAVALGFFRVSVSKVALFMFAGKASRYAVLAALTLYFSRNGY
jgi:membrane protein YqaA with SNARE-associated domain